MFCESTKWFNCDAKLYATKEQQDSTFNNHQNSSRKFTDKSGKALHNLF